MNKNEPRPGNQSKSDKPQGQQQKGGEQRNPQTGQGNRPQRPDEKREMHKSAGASGGGQERERRSDSSSRPMGEDTEDRDDNPDRDLQ